ncbi:hypothetical protein [Rhizobium esperanzae]|uniref:Uncharacterized protein n=1 Tax=Rhizobium esperanzae TaxID=1967781 RepID=A0A7W6R1V2_9HYPH|nr:hypothetical protein [Rhizobium esperanzae]MBB4235101.1 hypothetical protein [Rhizobium esperanzae]
MRSDRHWENNQENVTGREILIEELGASEAGRILVALGRKGWGLWPTADRRKVLEQELDADRLERHGKLIRSAASRLAEGRYGEPTQLSEDILEIPVRPPLKNKTEWRDRCPHLEGGKLQDE